MMKWKSTYFNYDRKALIPSSNIFPGKPRRVHSTDATYIFVVYPELCEFALSWRLLFLLREPTWETVSTGDPGIWCLSPAWRI